MIPVIYNRILKYANDEDYLRYAEQVEQVLASGDHHPDSLRRKYIEKHRQQGQDTTHRISVYIKPKEPNLTVLDFAEADSITLQVVPGIGEVLAGRIIKYRESLGGLHQERQLLEVYGITQDVADRVFEYFPLSGQIQTKLNINQLDAAALAKHPYINFGQAKVIVAYRKQHGNYQQARDLLKIKIFNEAWLARLEPYLSF
ncbi:MAG TPA: helix-hairpin-helix domain-containing protein [Cyclobacteriaceae bacterium]|nr:helix-hairpin-helix domain-containing protein [Cyclobacteriaceae bacterium]